MSPELDGEAGRKGRRTERADLSLPLAGLVSSPFRLI